VVVAAPRGRGQLDEYGARRLSADGLRPEPSVRRPSSAVRCEGGSVSGDERGSAKGLLGLGETEGIGAAAHGQPKRSVRIAAGSHRMSISRLLTDSTKPVGPQT
jgi:hypothetical protein